MAAHELNETARALVADDKGILAADESSGRSRSASTPSSSSPRRRTGARTATCSSRRPGWRSSSAASSSTTRRCASPPSDGTPFAKLLADKGDHPGDQGRHRRKGPRRSPREKVTEGLDGLRERLQEYRELGARFAKWRAVITIGDGIPTAHCIQVNAHALARYAALCQEQGIVPIVEPEVLMDADNDIETCYRATKRTLHKVFDELYHQRIDLEGMLLKPNMVISGKQSPTQASAEEVADWTLRCFRETVPAAVPGIVFLSGGQSDQQASENLNAINSRRAAAVGALVLVRPRAAGAGAGGMGRDRRTTSRLGSRSSRCVRGTTAPPSRAATRPRWSSSPARLDPPIANRQA